MRQRIITAIIAAGLFVSSVAAQTDTAFTYQGRLDFQGEPYTGDADYRFSLWDTASGGSQAGEMETELGVAVEEGLFTARLDFGASALAEQRWLQIAVRTPAWDGVGDEPAFTALTERQAVTPAPYALATRGIFVDDSGRVGINTTLPAGVIPNARLGVAGGHVVVDNGLGALSENASGTGAGAGFDTRTSDWLDLFAGGSAGATLTSSGLFGLGTTNPQRRLDVVGDARFGGPGAVIELGDGGDDTAMIRGDLELDDGAAIRFPDGTTQSTAFVPGPRSVRTLVFTPSFFIPGDGQATITFPSVNGAVPGRAVILTPPFDLFPGHVIAYARVSAPGIVTARIVSTGGGDRTYISGTWRITIFP